MPKKSWGSIAQKRAQQKAAEASARKRRKRRSLDDILKRKKRAEGSFSATRKDSVKIAREHDLSGHNRSEANKAAYRASGGAAKNIRATTSSKTTADRTYSAAKSLQLKAPTTKRGSKGKVGLSTRVSTPDNYKKASTGRDIGKDKPFSREGLSKLNSATEKRTREELSKMSDAEIHKLAYKAAHPDKYSGVGLRHKWAAEEAKKRNLDVSSNLFARGSQVGTNPDPADAKKTKMALVREFENPKTTLARKKQINAEFARRNNPKPVSQMTASQRAQLAKLNAEEAKRKAKSSTRVGKKSSEQELATSKTKGAQTEIARRKRLDALDKRAMGGADLKKFSDDDLKLLANNPNTEREMKKKVVAEIARRRRSGK